MSEETKSIERIIEDWRAGISREENFRSLFERYYRPVYRFFEKRGFSVDESQDLTQETFLRVYIGMSGFRGQARFETWLFQIAANTYRKDLRRQSAHKREGHHISLDDASSGHGTSSGVVGVADPSSAEGPLEVVLEKEQQRALGEAMAELPEQMRKCVMLRVYQELSYKEIAVVMRLSVETVKAHLYQARRKLKVKLADYFAELSF